MKEFSLLYESKKQEFFDLKKEGDSDGSFTGYESVIMLTKL